MTLGDAFPGPGPTLLGGVRLPAGELIYPTLMLEPGHEAGPALWATNERLSNPGPVWEALLAPAGERGLVPVVLDELQGEPGRPWDTGELGLPRPSTIDGFEATEVLRDLWLQSLPIGSGPMQGWTGFQSDLPGGFDELFLQPELHEEIGRSFEQVAPWGTQFPGLAVREDNAGPLADYQRVIHLTPPGRIGLVMAARSADIPHRIGWEGAANYFLAGAGPGLISVVMRSWEDRFGARLLRIGFDTLEFIVERPPSSEQAALSVAAEHFAFAGDSLRVSQRSGEILGRPTWRFWWD
jgi:hypothetical protein